MNRILVVDDEAQILKVMKRLFSETGYEIITAENGIDALKLLGETEVDLIISDMKMPLTDGYRLLSTVKEKYPNIIRISLSGYAEETSIYRASLHNISDFIIFKPWNNEKLLHDINRIFATHSVLNSKALETLTKDAPFLEEMPENCKKLLSFIENEDEDALIAGIEQNPVLSKLLMQVANWAIYGAMPGSIRQTAIYIGMHNLKCFLHWAAMVIQASPTHAKKEDNITELLWKHAYSTNKILLFLYEAFLHKQPPEASLFTGLLHNIGLIVLLQRNPEMYKKLFHSPTDITQDLLSLEKEKYGVNHPEIGAYLLNHKDLPFPIVEAALYHHSPLDSVSINNELVICVHIAEYYAWKFILGKNYTELKEEAFEQINVSRKDFETRLERFRKKIVFV
ncbi:MAG: HDOD domain-containing protein [Lachnospiraceae bacterium]|jgi:CheY-like chemotaxis protein|nr:HDOD domain-containing protein [Lachnospiraceae bacterium]